MEDKIFKDYVEKVDNHLREFYPELDQAKREGLLEYICASTTVLLYDWTASFIKDVFAKGKNGN